MAQGPAQPSDELIARRYLISGLVQGVGYRWFVQREGRRLGLRGWVRNLPDGAVEAKVLGWAGVLGQFEASLSSGPPHSKVTKVDIFEIPDEPDLPSTFAIWRSSD